MLWAGADAAAIRPTAARANRRYRRPIISSRAASSIGGFDVTRAVYMRPTPPVLSFANLLRLARKSLFPGKPTMEHTKPPFRAEHVGSLSRPAALIGAREKADKGEISDTELKRIQHAAIREVVRLQEELGLKLVTAGEHNRASWHRDFMLKFHNSRATPSKLTVRLHSADGLPLHTPPPIPLPGRLARPTGGLSAEDFRFLASIARAMPKITLPSPTVMHFRGGRGAIDADAYPDIAAFYDDLARLYREEIGDLGKAGCRYLQIDEVNLAYLCDPELRKQVTNIGEDPTALPQTYAKLLNAAIKDRPQRMTVFMHLCPGNFAAAWVANGGYARVSEPVFNDISMDC